MLKNMNKTTKNNMITYLMVIVVYAVIQVLVTSGSLSSLFTGLLVPICTYIILAISMTPFMHLEKNALVNAPIHMNPACPRLSSPRKPTTRFREIAKMM